MSGLDDLREVVAAAILQRAEEVSERLAALGVPHALIGGLAVGVHGYPRATKDVDFLVGMDGGQIFSFTCGNNTYYYCIDRATKMLQMYRLDPKTCKLVALSEPPASCY